MAPLAFVIHGDLPLEPIRGAGIAGKGIWV